MVKLLAFACWLFPGVGWALGPHEVAVLVNKNSPRSLEVANYFVHLRHIPPQNIVLLHLPDSVLEPEATMSPEDFTKLIWDPARKVIRERRIEDHILAWIYSADFPVRITSDPEVSLQGITFARNTLPDTAMIKDGTYLSALFRGPDKVDGPEGDSITFERFTPLLRQAMPLPSMMLGFTGSRGMPVDQVVRNIKYGVVSDNSSPSPAVTFVVSDDVRSRCREWQFPRVQSTLKSRGINAVITSNAPSKETALMGLQMGTSWPAPEQTGSFLPGAMAEHLTSFAALFDAPEQAVLTEWLRAGATASAGTVTEPLSIWMKFPHARFFDHYASGCTMIESFFLSIRSPMQILLVGEPLARPWGQPMEITLVNLSDESKPVEGEADFMATLWPGLGQPNPELLFLLDGRAVMHAATDPQLKIDTRPLTDGYHELRVIAYARQQVRHQSYATAGFEVGNHARACVLLGVSSNAEVDIDHPLRLTVRPVGMPKEVAVICQERVLARAAYTADHALLIDPSTLGAGPNRLQAVALYKDNEAVRSPPVAINVARFNRPPEMGDVIRMTDTNGTVVLTMSGTDPENDTVRTDWFEPLALPGPGEKPREGVRLLAGKTGLDGEQAYLQADHTFAVCSFEMTQPVRELRASLSVTRDVPPMKGQLGGLAFNIKDKLNFSFFGLSGDTSAWMLGRYEDGKFKRAAARGAYLEPDTWYRIAVRATESGGLEALVNDTVMAGQPDGKLGDGPAGVMAGVSFARFKDISVSPPMTPADAFREEDDALLVLDADTAKDLTVIARCSDTSRSAEKTVMVKER
ncbi:MAG: hypothetical protein V1929_09220 [bacterium]